MKLVTACFVLVDVGARLAAWWPDWAWLVVFLTGYGVVYYWTREGRDRIAERATVPDGR